MKCSNKTLQFVLLLLCLPFVSAAGLFNITFNFDESIDEIYRASFYDAAAFWESKITGYRYDSALLNGIVIDTSIKAIDGASGILGQATATDASFFEGILLDGSSKLKNVAYSKRGFMEFDSADVDSMIEEGQWQETLLHEMAHVIGFGVGWGYNYLGTVYNDVYVAGSGQYTGEAALAAYQAEFDPFATFVPVELDNGASANGHWDEVFGGAALTGITDTEGRDLRDELMTSWSSSSSEFISQTTLAQFYDLGYHVVPEPSTVLIFIMGLSLLAGNLRRSRNR